MAVFPPNDHDHRTCAATILTDAERLCRDRKVRLTAQRRRVLEIVAASHLAVGAYEILERLAEGGRRPAPIMVYRALDFLIEQGLVHRLTSLNAFVACACSRAAHGAQFLICRGCGTIGEMTSAAVDRAIADAASSADFDVGSTVVEVAGLCSACRHAAADAARS
jgi:Fur family zinc uptake transcriptional regulator